MADRPAPEDLEVDLRRQLDAARRECGRLGEEVARLRRLLGLPDESPPSAVAERPPALRPPAESLQAVDANSPTTQKIATFRALFRGRDDVYPVLWINERTGKMGYSPACRGGWAAKRGRARDYLPLTDAVIGDHLTGNQTIGVYPLLREDTCWFLACDFDGPTWAQDVLGFLAVSERHGVPAAPERSRSGNGGHIWIFFAAPVAAVAARRLGTHLLRETMIARAEVDLANYDRLFPNQDFLPRGGFGNLIALPLQKKCRAVGNTEFLDGTLRPWPDRWAFLGRQRRLAPQEVEALLEQFGPLAVGPGTAGYGPRRPQDARPAPPRIACTVGALLSVEKSGLPPWLLAEIKHLASLHNPLFYQRQNLRFSTHGTPRFVKCYEEDITHIHLPRGILEDLHLAVKNAKSRLVLTDNRAIPPRISLRFHGILSPIQEDAVQSLLAHDQGVLVAPPGTGKTVMGCALAATRGLPTLILAHRKPILDQWRTQIADLLGLAPKAIGQIGGGKDRRTGVVDLAMLQSLKALEEPEAFFERYGLIIVDECHHIPAVSFESCIKRAPARYVLGLTATPYRRDGLQDIITMQCGPIRHTIAARHVGSTANLALELIVRETPFTFAGPDDVSIQEVFRALVSDENRTALVADDVLQALRVGRRCLVLSEWKEQCRALATQLINRGKAPVVLDGSVKKKAQRAILSAIHEAPASADLLIIATGQYLGEGFDCPQIDTLFLAFPVSFKGKLVQYVGRAMRAHGEKNRVLVYDYDDNHVPVLQRMHQRRINTYRTLGFGQADRAGTAGLPMFMDSIMSRPRSTNS
jgi:superfamily II DNA or RNA helicase